MANRAPCFRSHVFASNQGFAASPIKPVCTAKLWEWCIAVDDHNLRPDVQEPAGLRIPGHRVGGPNSLSCVPLVINNTALSACRPRKPRQTFGCMPTSIRRISRAAPAIWKRCSRRCTSISPRSSLIRRRTSQAVRSIAATSTTCSGTCRPTRCASSAMLRTKCASTRIGGRHDPPVRGRTDLPQTP